MDELKYLEKYLKYKQKYYELEHGGSKYLKNISLPKSPFNRSGPSSPIVASVDKAQNMVNNSITSNKAQNLKNVNLDLKTVNKPFAITEIITDAKYKELESSGTYTKNGKFDKMKAQKRIVGSILVYVCNQLLHLIKTFYANEDIKQIIMNNNLSTEDANLLDELELKKLYYIALNFITHCNNLYEYTQKGLILTSDNKRVVPETLDGRTNYSSLKNDLETLIDGIIVDVKGKKERKKGQIITYSKENDKFEIYSQDALKLLITKLFKKREEYNNKDYTEVAKIKSNFLGIIKNVETIKISDKNIHNIKSMSDLEELLSNIKTTVNEQISQQLLQIGDFQRTNKFSRQINVFETAINCFINLVRCSVTLGAMKFSDLEDTNQNLYIPELEEIKSIYDEARSINTRLDDLLGHKNMKLTEQQENLIETLKAELEMSSSDKVGIFNKLFSNKLSLKDFFKKEKIVDNAEFEFIDPLNPDGFDEAALSVIQEGKRRGSFTGSMITTLINSTASNTASLGEWIHNVLKRKKPSSPSTTLETQAEQSQGVQLTDLKTGEKFF